MHKSIRNKKIVLAFIGIFVFTLCGFSLYIYYSLSHLSLNLQNNGDPYLIHVYNYESSDHGFYDIEVPEKGRTLEMVEYAFEEYKIKVGKTDIYLKRTFKMEPWNDPNHPRWRYDYMPSSKK